MSKKKNQPAKGLKMGYDELEQMIEGVVSKVIDEKSGGDDAGDDEKSYEGYEDVVEAVEYALEEVLEKRKARKDAGEDVKDDDLYDEILEEVIEYLEGNADEEKASDGREVPSEDEEIDDGIKTRRKPSARKQARRRSLMQRKYNDIYMTTPAKQAAAEEKKLPPEVQLARAVKCIDVFQAGAPRKDPERAAYFAKSVYGDERMEREFKNLATTVPSSGGYLVPEIYMNEIIELLYAKTVVVELGARKVPLANGNLNIPKMTTGSRARWGGEQRKIASSQPTFGNVRLSAKRLEAIVPMTRELLMNSDFSADQMFGQDLMRQMQLGLDFGAMFGTGDEFQPTGITNTDGILNINAATLGNPSLADAAGRITADFPVYVRSQVLAKNVDDFAMGWTFNSMMEGYLMNLKTSTGAYIYREEMNNGKLLGFPYRVSNQISTAANATSIIFGNWADLLIGDQIGLETYTTLDGTWTNEYGIKVSAFEENLSATRALMYVDTAARHAESFAYITNCVIA